MVMRAVQTASKLTPDFEVIVVNDGSADATPQIADELARMYPQVRVVHHAANRGYGGALQSGFKSATRELIFYTDGDAQYDPAELEALWPKMTADVDLVNGYKISRSDPWHRIVIGRVYHHLVCTLFNLRLRDVDCDFRLMRQVDLRARHPREDQRRHLSRDDEEDSGRRVPDRRSPGAPLSPRVRHVAVLQLPPGVSHRRRHPAAVGRARPPAPGAAADAKAVASGSVTSTSNHP